MTIGMGLFLSIIILSLPGVYMEFKKLCKHSFGGDRNTRDNYYD